MKCGNCNLEFKEDQLVEIRGTNRFNKPEVIAHECPGCGDPFSMEYTRQWNAERCSCSARVDESDGREVCSDCGQIHTLHELGGIREQWANPASLDSHMDSSDSYRYWNQEKN